MNYIILVVIVIAVFGSIIVAALAREGLPGFVPLKNGKAGSPEHKPEDGAS